jgi:hypothetical protein
MWSTSSSLVVVVVGVPGPWALAAGEAQEAF